MDDLDRYLPPYTADVARARRQTIGSLLARTAIKYPAELAVVYRDARRSFAELDADANRVANALAERGVVRLRETYAGLAGAGAP
jgi:fatty-acyl-CoA synthase